MRLYEKILFVAGLAVVGITLAYRYVLNEEQRDGIREAGSVLRNAGQEVADSVSPLVKDGPTHADEVRMAEENRAKTAAEWEAVGF